MSRTADPDVITERLIWAYGTSHDDATPDVAMENAWSNLLEKAESFVSDDRDYLRKYVSVVSRNDVYNASCGAWVVTLTARIDLA